MHSLCDKPVLIIKINLTQVAIITMNMISFPTDTTGFIWLNKGAMDDIWIKSFSNSALKIIVSLEP